MPIIRTSQQLQELFRKRKEEKLKQKELEKQKKKEQLKQYQKEYQRNYRRNYNRLEDPSYIQYQKEYREEHKEKYLEYQRKYREKHREEHRLQQKAYRERNKEYYREYDRLRRQKIKLSIEDYTLPPVTSREQVIQIYEDWLSQLKQREQFLDGFKLYINQLMQSSVQKTLDNMGRNHLTIAEIKDKQLAISDSLQELKEKRKHASTEEEKNDLTSRIKKQKASLSNFNSRYAQQLGLNKNDDDETKNFFKGSNVHSAMQRLEEKANTLIAQAKTIEEKKRIEEQLYYAKLRYKYSCC